MEEEDGCSKHSRRSWRRMAWPAFAESNLSGLAAEFAWRFVNAPHEAREVHVATLLFDRSQCNSGEQGDQQCAELQSNVDAQPAIDAVRGGEQAEDGAAEFQPEGDFVRCWAEP